MTQRRIRSMLAAGIAIVGVALVAGPASAAKSGPNNENAKRCQKGGYQNYSTAEAGPSFANGGQCISSGAAGSALVLSAVTVDAPTHWTYGSVFPGELSASHTFTFRNGGNRTVSLISYAVSPGAVADPGLTCLTVKTSLAPGETCTVPVGADGTWDVFGPVSGQVRLDYALGTDSGSAQATFAYTIEDSIGDT